MAKLRNCVNRHCVWIVTQFAPNRQREKEDNNNVWWWYLIRVCVCQYPSQSSDSEREKKMDYKYLHSKYSHVSVTIIINYIIILSFHSMIGPEFLFRCEIKMNEFRSVLRKRSLEALSIVIEISSREQTCKPCASIVDRRQSTHHIAHSQGNRSRIIIINSRNVINKRTKVGKENILKICLNWCMFVLRMHAQCEQRFVSVRLLLSARYFDTLKQLNTHIVHINNLFFSLHFPAKYSRLSSFMDQATFDYCMWSSPGTLKQCKINLKISKSICWR